MDYFDVKGKKYLVFGVANKKSVAYFIAQSLISLVAEVILPVLNDEVKQKTEKISGNTITLVKDILQPGLYSTGDYYIFLDDKKYLEQFY